MTAMHSALVRAGLARPVNHVPVNHAIRVTYAHDPIDRAVAARRIKDTCSICGGDDHGDARCKYRR